MCAGPFRSPRAHPCPARRHRRVDAARHIALKPGSSRADLRRQLASVERRPRRGQGDGTSARISCLTILGGSGKSLDDLRAIAPANVTFPGQGAAPRHAAPICKKRASASCPTCSSRSARSTLSRSSCSSTRPPEKASLRATFPSSINLRWTHGSNSARVDRRRPLPIPFAPLAQRGINPRCPPSLRARQFLWEDQGVAMKQFLESVIG